ncbi:putative Zinc finger, MIZ-type, Zinc finger, RING/FYVE/PHD-type [Dioscorea sansibarensis]
MASSSAPRPFPLHLSTMANSSTPPQGTATAAPQAFKSALQANAFRLEMVVQRLSMHFRTGVRHEEFSDLCFFLARGIDYALSKGDVPSIARCLPSLIQQVYDQRKCASLQSAILVLMISLKNACQQGWFHLLATNEILRMTNELCSNFCTAASVTADPDKALGTISEIIPRYYPQLKLCRLIVSLEAKPGYEILFGDFHIPSNIPPGEKIALFVARTDNLETSSCIINPPQVSILINGKAVDKRNNVSLDHGAQFPTDITKFLKYGTNIIQALGYFSGNYVIAIAFISKMVSASPSTLLNYVHPVVSTIPSDADIIEGPSRISLNCPISFRRIKTPVKGWLCKHHQCFDYDNFMEMNSRKPSWRCPCCNQPTSCIDLRVDQNMIRVLRSVAEDITDVVISADGSWEVVADHNGDSDQLQKGSVLGLQHGVIESRSSGQSINPAHVVDLTIEQNGDSATGIISGVVEALNGSNHQICDTLCTERKPFEKYKGFSGFEFHFGSSFENCTSVKTQEAGYPAGNNAWLRVSSSSVNELSASDYLQGSNALGTLETLLPNCVLNPIMSNTTGIYQEPTVNRGVLQSSFSLERGSRARQVAENSQLQQSQLDNSVCGILARSVSTSRHVHREPIAVLTPPVEIQTTTSSQRPGTNVLSSTSMFGSNLSPRSYPMGPSRLAVADPLNTSSCDRDSGSSMQHLHSTKQVFGLPTSKLVGTRGQVASQRGVASNIHSLPPSSSIQDSTPQQTVYWTNQIVSNSTTARPHSPSDLSMQCRPMRNSAGQFSPMAGGLPAGTAYPQTSRISPSINIAHDGGIIAGGDALHQMVGGSHCFGTSDHLPQLPAEPNLQPTGRMRGTLTGLAYLAALNHYSPHPIQEVPPRPSANLPAFNYNS